MTSDFSPCPDLPNRPEGEDEPLTERDTEVKSSDALPQGLEGKSYKLLLDEALQRLQHQISSIENRLATAEEEIGEFKTVLKGAQAGTSQMNGDSRRPQIEPPYAPVMKSVKDLEVKYGQLSNNIDKIQNQVPSLNVRMCALEKTSSTIEVESEKSNVDVSDRSPRVRTP